MAEMKLSELAKVIGGELSGEGEAVIRGLATIETAGPDEVTFLTNARYVKHVESTRAAAVIVAKNYAGPGRSLLRCEDPYFAFREAMVAFYGFRRPHFEGIDPRAVIDPTARLAADARVAPFATIGPDVEIGPGAVIYSGVHIGPRCRIGGACTLYPNVVLYDGTILHDRVTIHGGTSIGHDGFGYATHAGRHEKIPQVGWVELEDDVEIGANCAIDRATMGPTVVGAGTKFSNLIAVGHGTRLGKHCLVVALVGLGGSTIAGNYCVFGGQSGFSGHIRIGDGVRVAAQAGVINDVPKGEEVIGFPAIPLRGGRRAYNLIARLPQMRSALKRLLREFRELQKRLGAAPEKDDANRDEEDF